MFNNPTLTVVGFILAAVAALGGAIWPEYAQIMWGLAGFFGFASMVEVRGFLESKGWKTKAIGWVTALAGIVAALGILPIEVYEKWMGIAGALKGATLTHGVIKSPALKAGGN